MLKQTLKNEDDQKLSGIKYHIAMKSGLVRVQNLLADNCYIGQPFAQGVSEIQGEHVTVQIAKRIDLGFPAFKIISKRWVVERSSALLEKTLRIMEELRIAACSLPTWPSHLFCSK